MFRHLSQPLLLNFHQPRHQPRQMRADSAQLRSTTRCDTLYSNFFHKVTQENDNLFLADDEVWLMLAKQRLHPIPEYNESLGPNSIEEILA